MIISNSNSTPRGRFSWSSYWTKLIGAAVLMLQNNDAFITEDGEYLILE